MVVGLGLRVLHVAGYGLRLSASRGSLVVEGGGERSVVPLSEVDVVIVASRGVRVSSDVLRLLLRSGIEFVLVDYRGEPVGVLWPSYLSRTPATRRAQYAAHYDGRAGLVAGWIARRKIEGQACHLESLAARLGSGDAREAAARLKGLALRALEAAASAGEPGAAAREAMKVEAWAAREYWGVIASLLPRELGFEGRSRESGDPVNAALNYGYAILYSAAWRAVALAGLDPYAGFLHRDRSGNPTLVFDFSELYRAVAVDWPLVAALLGGWRPRVEGVPGRLDYDSREEAARLVVRRLNSRAPGARWSLEEDMRREARALARALRSGAVWEPLGPCRGSRGGG